MTDKELRRLSRSELLEMLLSLTEENEKLKKRLDQQEKELKRQKHLIENLKSKIKHPIKTVLGRAGK